VSRRKKDILLRRAAIAAKDIAEAPALASQESKAAAASHAVGLGKGGGDTRSRGAGNSLLRCIAMLQMQHFCTRLDRFYARRACNRH